MQRLWALGIMLAASCGDDTATAPQASLDGGPDDQGHSMESFDAAAGMDASDLGHRDSSALDDANQTSLDASHGATDPSSATFEGSVAGFAMTPVSAAFLVEQGGELLSLIITDQPNTCALLQQGFLKVAIFESALYLPSSRFVTWSVFGQDELGSPAPVQPGPVALGAPPFEGGSAVPPPATGQFGFPTLNAVNEQCRRSHPEYDDARTIEVEFHFESLPSESGGLAHGTFSITQGQETLSGAFAAVRCERPVPPPSRPPCP